MSSRPSETRKWPNGADAAKVLVCVEAALSQEFSTADAHTLERWLHEFCKAYDKQQAKAVFDMRMSGMRKSE